MWLVMYNGITGECICEAYSDSLFNVLSDMGTFPNDSWFII